MQSVKELLVQVVGEHENSLKRALSEFGVYLKPSSYGQDVKPLLKESCRSIFGNSAGLVDMMVQHFPSSKDGNIRKVRLLAHCFAIRKHDTTNTLSTILIRGFKCLLIER